MPDANYDESMVPYYTLPDPLMCEDSTQVTDAEGWEKRRAEILSMFEDQVYGKMPGATNEKMICQSISTCWLR